MVDFLGCPGMTARARAIGSGKKTMKNKAEIPCVFCGEEAIIHVGERSTCEKCFLRVFEKAFVEKVNQATRDKGEG